MAANPGTVRAESVRFVEADGTAAGTWSASFVIPAGSILVDVVIVNDVAWTATTSATLIVGDATDPDGYFAAVDLKTMTAGQGLSFAFPLAKQGAYVTPNIATSVGILRSLKAGSERTVSASVTTVGAPVTTKPGDTTVTFVYAYPSPQRGTWLAT
jgi:hypothetical protein